MSNYEPLAEDKIQFPVTLNFFSIEDVLSALKGLEAERNAAQKCNDIYRKSSEEVQNDWFDALDKWFPILQSQRYGDLDTERVNSKKEEFGATFVDPGTDEKTDPSVVGGSEQTSTYDKKLFDILNFSIQTRAEDKAEDFIHDLMHKLDMPCPFRKCPYSFSQPSRKGKKEVQP
jgi:hypothetical protein